MSNPDAIFFDTGPLLSLFNKSEKTIVEVALSHVDKYPHAARLIVTPSLVELFYKLRKVISPKDIRIGLDAYGIKLFSNGSVFEGNVFDDYSKKSHTHGYDYADYFLCRAALLLPVAHILTIDRDDFPNAYGSAYTDIKPKEPRNIQIITVK